MEKEITVVDCLDIVSEALELIIKNQDTQDKRIDALESELMNFNKTGGQMLKVCPECNKPTKPYVSHSRLKSSEFYCESCQRSYIMDKIGEPEHWANIIKQGQL